MQFLSPLVMKYRLLWNKKNNLLFYLTETSSIESSLFLNEVWNKILFASEWLEVCGQRNIILPPLFRLGTWEVGVPDGSAHKESTWNAGDLGSIPGLGRSPGEGNSYTLQNSGLENVQSGLYSPWVPKKSDTSKWLLHSHKR